MSKLFKYRLWLFCILVALTTLIGMIYDYLVYQEGEVDRFTVVWRSGFSWLVGASLVWGLEIFWVQSRQGSSIRRLHFLTAIAVKSVATLIIAILIAIFYRIVFEDSLDMSFLIQPRFLRTLGMVFAAIILLQTVLQTIRIIGGRNLINFVLGKYVRPVREETIFMFLDLVGSTPLAERLGDIGVHSMITKFFFDITEPIVQHGGQIHRYVGDQVVVTWPLRGLEENAQAVLCCFAIADYLRAKEEEYQNQFGLVPGYRIGLHGGPVVISQCGDQKQELSYFGDTVNTAARIEAQCKVLDSQLLMSGELLNRTALPEGFEPQLRGIVQLRGREKETELFMICRRE